MFYFSKNKAKCSDILLFSVSLFIHQIKSVSYMCISKSIVNAAAVESLYCGLQKIKHIRLGSIPVVVEEKRAARGKQPSAGLGGYV